MKIQTNKDAFPVKKERASVPEITIKEKKNIKNRKSKFIKKGSVTIEAAFAIPLFLYAALCLIWMIEIQNIRISIINASQNAAKLAAEDTAVIPVLNTVKLKNDIISLIGEERIERSIIENGCEGISCWSSFMIPGNNEMNITVIYKVRLPLSVFGFPGAKQKESFKISSWNGFETNESSENNQIVYITENQAVYHENYNCTYLQLSISFVSYEELSGMRNEGGGRYYPCEKCVYGNSMSGVYVSRTGNKYHNSLTCSGLKRTIYAVNKSEVSGMGGCSRCTG